MIHTVILGADTDSAGELIRILAMHPEVVLECAQARNLEGVPLTSRHHGLIGETDLAFSALPAVKKCDVVFDFSVNGEPALRKLLEEMFPDAKMIAMSRAIRGLEDNQKLGWVYGLPEINRKALVRGATRAVVPTPFASAALVALYPLALNLVLGDSIEISAAAPDVIIAKQDTGDTETEIRDALSEAQMSFKGKVKLAAAPSNTRRTALLSIEADCPVNVEHVMSMYDMYSDHHFAFATDGAVGASEVAGTDKCVVSLLGKSDDGTRLRLESVADCRMRGGAGEAVHIMNLLFGLHERVGLALKAIDFHPV